MEEWKVREIVGDRDWVESAAEDMEENPNLLINHVTFPEVYSDWVLINVTIAEKDLAERAVKKIGVALFLKVGEERFERLKREKAHIETEIEAVEHQMAAFCDDYCESYYQELAAKKEKLEFNLNLVENYIYEQFGELGLEQQQFLLETDPTYMVLAGKQKELTSDLIEIELLKRRIKQGFVTEADLISEPVYVHLVEKQNNLFIDFYNTEYSIAELEGRKYDKEVEQYIYAEPVSGEPINRNWRLNIVLAVVLGLMISVPLIFVRPYLGEFVASIRRSEDDEK